MVLSVRNREETGRQERFEALYEEHFDALLAYALRRTERETAYDAVGEAFLTVWRRLEDVPEDALPWLYGVIRRTLANQRRSIRRRRSLVSKLTHNQPEPVSAEPKVGSSPLREALERLSGREREALLLTAWEGLDCVRAAAALGISPVAFRVRLHRAKRKLAHELGRPEAQTPAVASTAKEQP
jgi:RNA polymerase sigma-70 factor (ECF subfamily)